MNRLESLIDAIKGPRVESTLRFQKGTGVLTRMSSIRGWKNVEHWKEKAIEEEGKNGWSLI